MEDKLIIYEDGDIIVCRKPAGIPVQSARIGQKDMVSILNNYLAEKHREAKPDPGRKDMTAQPKKSGQKDTLEPVRVVHRLDQPVEGVIVFAKTKRAAAGLAKQLNDGRMKKIYHAVCCVTEGVCRREWYGEMKNLLPDEIADFTPDEIVDFMSDGITGRMADKMPGERRRDQLLSGRIYQLVDYLVRDGRTNTSCVTDKGKKDAKRAELSYRILDAAKVHKKIYLLAEIELKTGRHHQIRVQMAHAGLPLYGDTKYNDDWEKYRLDFHAPDVKPSSGGLEYQVSGSSERKNPGLALCAVSLTFCHPVSGDQMTFETKPEAEIFNIFPCA